MTSQTRTSTAHEYWDGVWQDSIERRPWESPSGWVMTLADAWWDVGIRSVLDLGCGVGRHCVALATRGFTVVGADRSASACVRARSACVAADVSVEIAAADFDALPWPAEHFDAVLAYNVVYHGTQDDLRTALAEVRRVLRPGGRYASTMLSTRNVEYGRGVEVAPGSFVRTDATDDKTHPHLYCDAEDLVRLHRGFTAQTLVDAEQSVPGSFHWFCEFDADARDDQEGWAR